MKYNELSGCKTFSQWQTLLATQLGISPPHLSCILTAVEQVEFFNQHSIYTVYFQKIHGEAKRKTMQLFNKLKNFLSLRQAFLLPIHVPKYAEASARRGLSYEPGTQSSSPTPVTEVQFLDPLLLFLKFCTTGKLESEPQLGINPGTASRNEHLNL